MAYTTITAATIGLADGDQSPQMLDGTIRITPRFAAAATPDGLIATGPVVVEVAGGAIPKTDVPAQADATALVEFHLYDAEVGPVRLPNTEIPLEPDSTISLRDYLPAGVDPATGQVVTRGPRGYGITGITAEDGVVTVIWEGGDNTEIPIPTAALATRFNDGLMPKSEFAKIAPIKKGDPQEWRVTDLHGQVALRVTEDGAVETAGTESRASEAPYRVVDANDRIAFEVDAQGRTHIHDLVASNTGLKELHVFVAAGQSNMKGHAQPHGGELDPENPRILQYGVTRRVIEPATTPMDFYPEPVGVSPAWFFAQKYLETQPDHVGVLIVPCAKGGTGFNSGTGTGGTWDNRQAGGEVIDLYGESVTQTLEALAAATIPATLKAILWHQGESDQYNPGAYGEQLDRLIENYRTDLSNSKLPFVLGQQTREGMELNSNRLLIDAIHQDTPRRVHYSGFAPSLRGATNYADPAHFAREGAEHMGHALVDAYHRAVTNVPGFGPPQPKNVAAEFINGTLSIRWAQQMRRVTEYRVEYRIDGGSWVEVTREHPMNLTETVEGLAGSAAEVRVTSVNLAQEQEQMYPVIVPHTTW